ncbi:UNVERIFIED_CONTAM: ferric reductase-like transmembrane domain-containing protein, partial [Bacteroidetes bacterium 56_B9]
LAIRSGMLAVALMPWIVGLSMKANFIALLTGIGHERLNVLHRWLAYVFLVLSIVHTVPFYVTPVWDGGMQEFHRLLKAQQSGVYIYGTGTI